MFTSVEIFLIVLICVLIGAVFVALARYTYIGITVAILIKAVQDEIDKSKKE